jgi:nicotinate (nicotinamide) nucleotide adenylyltransferase
MQNIAKIYNLQSLNFLRNCRLNVGVLGGSFNPAHRGHLQLSYQALKILNLDYLIWLVALQNPLKLKYHLDIFARSRMAAQFAQHPKILVSSAEYDMNSHFIYNSLNKLCCLFKTIKFTFLMGGDNIENFHKWYRYQDIVNICQIVIFDRPNIFGHLNFNRFTMKFKANIDKTQTNPIMIHRGIMSEMSSSTIREKLAGKYDRRY